MNRFTLGTPLMTSGAAQVLAPFLAASLILRHAAGDWGDVCVEDQQANEDAITHGDRILSAYVVNDKRFYVITEADRSSTTVLLCEEY